MHNTGPRSSSRFSFISGLIEKVRGGIELLKDGYKIITQKEAFILGELTDRAAQSQDGYASTYIGLPFFKLASFHVFTGEHHLKEAVSYGEYQEAFPEKYDPRARQLFDPLKDFLGNESIINLNGPEVPMERKVIKDHLTMYKALDASKEVFSKIAANWSQTQSINHQICLACTQVIATAWLHCKDIPEELIPLLKKAEHAVFNRDKVSNSDFEKLKRDFQALNDAYMDANEPKILSEDSYLKHMLETGKAKHLKELNGLFALVVEGNITTVLTCAILELASNKELQSQLREELKSVDLKDLDSINGFAKIKSLKQLHNIYIESLRTFAPAPPLVRYASKAGRIGDKEISARSYLFMPLRSIMHDHKKWENPEHFNPQRHENTPHKINFYPLTPFSTGPRVCPASFGFTEALFKTALVILFKNNELSLTSHASVEQIPVKTKEPRLKQSYFGKLEKNEPSARAIPVTPYHAVLIRGENELRSFLQSPSVVSDMTNDRRNVRYHF